MTKLVKYAGGTSAVLLFVYWLGRRAGKRSAAAGLGGAISTIDYPVAMPRLAAKVAGQIKLAMSKSPLRDYRNAGNNKSFMDPPTTNVQAYYTAAYWSAVAARILGSAALTSAARTLATKGLAVFALPFSSQLTGSVESIMQAAAADISAAGSTNRQVAGILTAMHQLGSQPAIEAAKQRAADQNVLANTAKASGGDVVEGLDYLRAAIGLDKPGGGTYPWLHRWGPRIVIGGAVLAGVAWYTKPAWKAVVAARKSAQPAVAEKPKEATSA